MPQPNDSDRKTDEAIGETIDITAEAALHAVAVSCASFIADIQNSSEVAEYLERRLGPLLGMPCDECLRDTLQSIAADDRPWTRQE